MQDEVLGNLEEINQRVHRVGEVMTRISAGSARQSDGVDYIMEAVREMNDATSHRAASAEYSAEAAQELKNQASLLQNLVRTFRLRSTPAESTSPAESMSMPADDTRRLDRPVEPMRSAG